MHMVCYGQEEMACHLRLVIWDAVTTCTPITIFFILEVRLCSEKKRKQQKQQQQQQQQQQKPGMA